MRLTYGICRIFALSGLKDHPDIKPNAIRYYSLYQSESPSFRVSDPARYDLFSTYGVKIIDVPVYKGDYEEAYRVAIDLIADVMYAEDD